MATVAGGGAASSSQLPSREEINLIQVEEAGREKINAEATLFFNNVPRYHFLHSTPSEREQLTTLLKLETAKRQMIQEDVDKFFETDSPHNFFEQRKLLDSEFSKIYANTPSANSRTFRDPSSDTSGSERDEIEQILHHHGLTTQKRTLEHQVSENELLVSSYFADKDALFNSSARKLQEEQEASSSCTLFNEAFGEHGLENGRGSILNPRQISSRVEHIATQYQKKQEEKKIEAANNRTAQAEASAHTLNTVVIGTTAAIAITAIGFFIGRLFSSRQ